MSQDLTKISLSHRSKVVSNKKMTLMERFYLPAIFKGMTITLGHFFKKEVTVQYPEVKREFSEFQ